MNIQDIMQLPSMPVASPSYPRGPYRFINREYLIISYRSDPNAIRKALGGLHFIADLTLPYGRVLHDYLAGQPASPRGA